jgi:hypothetical protein
LRCSLGCAGLFDRLGRALKPEFRQLADQALQDRAGVRQVGADQRPGWLTLLPLTAISGLLRWLI